MKTKMDFVTNSSSTSFVIADFRKDNETLMLEYDWGIINLLKAIPSKIIKDYESYLDEMDDEDEIVKEVFEKGGIVHILKVSDGGYNPIEAGFCQIGITDLKVPEGVEVIKGEGGY